MKDIEIEIMNASAKLFGSKGFDNTTTLSIAKSANVGSGTIYKFFKNKDDLIERTYIYTKKSLIQYIRKRFDDSLSFRENLPLIWKEVLRWSNENIKEFQFLEQIRSSRFFTSEGEAIVFKDLEFVKESMQKSIDKNEVNDVNFRLFVYSLTTSVALYKELNITHRLSQEESINMLWRGLKWSEDKL